MDREHTPESAADLLGYSRQTITNWIVTGRLKATGTGKVGAGRGYKILESDLFKASRAVNLASPDPEPLAMRMDTPEDRRRDALSLEVYWPAERRSQTFSSELLGGFDTFHALTYTASITTILKLLTTHDFTHAEVVFGAEDLLTASASKVVKVQEAIETVLARGYMGLGGVTHPDSRRLMEYQVEGRAAFYAMAGGIVHSKLYFLERPGLSRVLVGSANLSERAMSGKQGEVLLAFDNDEWMWQNLMRKYEAVREVAVSTPLKTQIKAAHLVRTEDLPAGRQALEDDADTVEILVLDGVESIGNPDQIAVRTAELDAHLGEALQENLVNPPRPGAPAVLRRGSFRRINNAVSVKVPREPAKGHHLERGENRFIYDGRAIERPNSDDGIDRDAQLIIDFINKFHEFGDKADILQRNYYAFMGWLYFAPFMPGLARRCHVEGGNASKSFKHIAIIYGESNCGKSALSQFLQTSMFGAPSPIGSKGFTMTAFEEKAAHAGILPIYYADIDKKRFGERGENNAERIAKYYDLLVEQSGNYPCAVITSNADEFSNEFRNRAFLVNTPVGVASDDSAMKVRLDNEALPLRNRIGQDFYAEYLYRMTDIVDRIEDVAQFDYLDASTRLIKDLLLESRHRGESLPEWVHTVTATEFDERTWQLKHHQLNARLSQDLYTAETPPADGKWTATDTQILIGVPRVGGVLQANEFLGHWIDKVSTVKSGNVIYLRRDEVDASLRRTIPDWRLPIPMPLWKRLTGRK